MDLIIYSEGSAAVVYRLDCLVIALPVARVGGGRRGKLRWGEGRRGVCRNGISSSDNQVQDKYLLYAAQAQLLATTRSL